MLVSAQQTAYEYTYDNAGNRTMREMIILPPVAPGGGGNALVQEPLIAQIAPESKSAERGSTQEILELSLYPNPTTSSVNVKFSQSEVLTNEVRIIDNNGKVMYSKNDLSGDFEVPFDNLIPGNYFIWLSLQGEIKRFQVVKQ